MSGRPQIHVYTGGGKGKTTAALGLLLRFLGSGGKACLIQFDKGAPPGHPFYSERKALERFPELTLHATGMPRFSPENGTFRFKNVPGDISEARQGLALAKAALEKGYGMVVLDEILSLPLTELLPRVHIEGLVEEYERLGRPCELILTGHELWPELEARVDLVTEMTKRKHYFDQHLKARKGIEY